MKSLDPKARALLTAIAAAGEPDVSSIPVATAREEMNRGYARLKTPVKLVGSICNSWAGEAETGIPLRIYTPAGDGPFPVIIFFHGGGWVFYLEEAYESICTHLCEASHCLVFSVGYRLAPEHKFPAAVEDAFQATYWIIDHCRECNGDPSSILLAGDSAGGNLAAVTAVRLRDETQHVIRGQVLVYPVTDHRDSVMPSYDEFSNGMGLTREAMKWYWDQYLANRIDAMHPHAAPLLTKNLAGLPPTLILTAGYDPVRDEGIAYARRLAEAGVNVQLCNFEDMIHGFLSYLSLLKQGYEAVIKIAEWVKNLPGQTAPTT